MYTRLNITLLMIQNSQQYFFISAKVYMEMCLGFFIH